MDKWVMCGVRCYGPLTVFQSYRADKIAIMSGYVQWNTYYDCNFSASKGIRIQNAFRMGMSLEVEIGSDQPVHIATDGCGQAMVPGNFQCWGVLLIWIIVGQGLSVPGVGADGGSLSYHISFLSHSSGDGST